jgi:hypothetical protein
MGHCTDCYGTSTIAPCATVGCISTNYAKCITYSGVDLYCSLGAVGTLNSSGTAVVPGTTTVYTLGGTNLSGSGTGATFEVTRTAGSDAYTVKIANRGSGYAVGNQVKILGTSLGGATTANDLVITIATLNPVIPTGATLDAIITTFHNALCSSVAGGGIDYSALSYSCLRQGGALTGLGTAITTESQFVTSASAALCALNTTMQDYDAQITLNTIEGSIPGLPGSYNLDQYLTSLTSYVNSINAALDFGSITGNPCVAYAFTTKPTSTDSVADYFNWITTNMCGMYTSLNGNVTTVTTTANSLKTYISGASAVPANVNTSTLPGGSSTSTASVAINLLVSQVAALNAISATIPASTYALTWASAFPGSYPANSAFKGQTWNYTNTAASIQTQFDRIVSILSSLNIKFDATHFTVSTGSYGVSIALAPAYAFSAASLNTCYLNDLGDVNSATPTNNHFLVRDVSGQWTNKSLNITINGSGTNVAKTDGPGVGGAVTFDLTIPDATPTIYALTGNSTAEYTVSNAVRFPLGSQPMPYGVKQGGIVTLHGVLQMSMIGAFSWTHLGSKIIASLPSAIRPTNPVYFVAEVYVKASGTYAMTNTRATGQIDSSGNLTLILMNSAGSISLVTSDLIEVVIGGITYAI